jgi:hypothetical protein
VYPVIDLDRTDPGVRQRFVGVPRGPAVLSVEELTARALPELDPRYVTAVEDGWTAQVLQRWAVPYRFASGSCGGWPG